MSVGTTDIVVVEGSAEDGQVFVEPASDDGKEFLTTYYWADRVPNDLDDNLQFLLEGEEYIEEFLNTASDNDIVVEWQTEEADGSDTALYLEMLVPSAGDDWVVYSGPWEVGKEEFLQRMVEADHEHRPNLGFRVVKMKRIDVLWTALPER